MFKMTPFQSIGKEISLLGQRIPRKGAVCVLISISMARSKYPYKQQVIEQIWAATKKNQRRSKFVASLINIFRLGIKI